MTPSERSRLSWLTRRAGLEAAFDARIDRSAGPEACWPWMGGKFTTGYGVFERNGRRVLVHRAALARSLGRALTRDEYALHRCDNRPCCNPAHLYAGTIADNNRDALERGQHRSGRPGFHKTTPAERAAMVARVQAGERIRDVAAAFRVNPVTVHRAVRAAA